MQDSKFHNIMSQKMQELSCRFLSKSSRQDEVAWCADHYNENNRFHCFSQSESFGFFNNAKKTWKIMVKEATFTTNYMGISVKFVLFSSKRLFEK